MLLCCKPCSKSKWGRIVIERRCFAAPLQLGYQMHQRAQRSVTNKTRHKRKVERIKNHGPRLHVMRDPASEFFWHQTLGCYEKEQREDEQSKRMIVPAFEEHSSHAATEAAGEATAKARQAGAALKPTD